MKKAIFTLIVLWIITLNIASGSTIDERSTIKIFSPDRHILFNLRKIDGKYCYSINYDLKQVIRESNLGLVMTGKQIEFDVPISAINKYEKNESYATKVFIVWQKTILKELKYSS